MPNRPPAHRHQPAGGSGSALFELASALSMTVGRGATARLVADLAGIGAGDRLVDVGCGPGAAAREATRRGAVATGVDPSRTMLRFARAITSLRRLAGATFVEGRAESLPLPDGTATVLWALQSVHHWQDRTRGLAEARRVLAEGGRLLVAERSVEPGARGLAAHGLTTSEADQLARAVETAGFGGVERRTRRLGRRTLVLLTAVAA